jgi:glycerol-3-phosphate dehydrogenase
VVVATLDNATQGELQRYENNYHYAKTLKRRHSLTKKGDVRSACLRRCITHYNVIRDARKNMSLISQYRRHALLILIYHHVEKLRRTIRVTRLALDDCLSYSGTNRRHMFSETRPQLSYAPSEFLQAASCILELARIW